MRLRAYVNNVSLLSGLAQTSASVASPCYLHFTPTTLRLISPAGQYGVQIWATLDVEAVFSNYRIESHHDNEIIIEVSADSLARVLRSASGALEVMLRLGKREKDPLLSWSIVMTSQSGTRLDVMQEIVVRILRQSEYSLISEPLCPKPDVYIVTPPLSEMRLVNDQMRSLSSHVVLAANHDGTLKLALADDDVIGSAYWTRLEHPNVQGDMEQDLLTESSRKKFHEVHMHTKALQGVLSCSMLAKSTVACFCSGYCVVFYVYLAGQSRQTRPMQRTGNNDRGVLNVRITLLNSGGSNRVSQFVVAGLAHDE